MSLDNSRFVALFVLMDVIYTNPAQHLRSLPAPANKISHLCGIGDSAIFQDLYTPFQLWLDIVKHHV